MDTSQPLHDLTDPQINLLLSLYHRPRYVARHYRPLQPLVYGEYVRPRSVTNRLAGEFYELTLKGKMLVQSILQERADKEDGQST